MADLSPLHERLDKISEDVTQIRTSQTRTEVHVQEVKEDLKEHMRRTDMNEARIHRIEKQEQWLKGAVWVVFGIGTLAITYLKLFNN